ncbi:CidA/LrgA family protein [Beijerinckia mobilis]|uniref:CidA/LrgA family protein n=1 Tax=Beijerinckia mobilis TaxID=231434 RepID=UPI00068A1A71|nr:CidA/LrgA family protein [Beijerinckia mobilis]
MIHALALLLFCQLLGEIFTRALGLSLPGPVAGLGFLFLWFCWRQWRDGAPDRVVSPEVETLATALLRYLAVLFIPVAVGVMDQAQMLRQYGVGIIVSVLLSGIAALAVTSLIFEWVMRRMEPPKEDGAAPVESLASPMGRGNDGHA